MPRYFVSGDAKQDDVILVTGADALHMMQSQRMRVGDTVDVVVDGEGVYSVVITAFENSTVVTKILERLTEQRDSPIQIVLYQGIAKGERMDIAVQKTTELGTFEIVPFFSQTCVVRLDERKARKRQERWQRIAHEAAKQCLRDTVPTVRHPIPFTTVVNEVGDGLHDLVVFPYERETAHFVSDIDVHAPKSVAVIIGPEGGFSGPEGEQLVAAGATVISLGPRILRTETAGVVALSLVGARFGDLGRKVERSNG